MSRQKVATTKPGSIRSPLPAAQAARRASLGKVEEAVGEGGQDEIKHAAGEIEDERLTGGTGRDLADAHQLGEAGDGDERGILQSDLPEIAQARNCETQHLRRDDAAKHQSTG